MAILQVGITAVAAWAVGARLLRRHWTLDGAGVRVAAETGIGLLTLSYLLYGLAIAGALLGVRVVTPTLLWLLMAGLTVVAASAAPDLVRAARAIERRGDPWRTVGIVLGGLWLVWMILTAALPPISLDEMVYHLEVPKRVLQVGWLPAFTDNVLAYYPMGPQMLFTFGLGLGGETAARLFHVLYGLLVMVALYGVARSVADVRSSVLATALFLSVPTAMKVGAWAYIDLNFTLYALLALVATIRYVKERESGERAALRWAVLAGVMAGAAWTVKYTALQLTLLLILLVLIEHLRSRPRELPVGVVAIGGIAVALFVPHLARTWLLTGWPLFPFQLGPFELAEGINWSPEQAELALAWQRQYGAGYDRALWERLMAMVWVFTSANDNYTAYDGVAGSGFLLAPLAFLVRPARRELRMIATFFLMFVLYWALTTTQVRFLIPALPVGAVLLAALASFRVRRLVAAALGFLVIVNLVIVADEVLKREPAGVWTGRESRRDFLARNLGPYSIYEEANRRIGAGERVLLVNMRTWGYLLDLPGDGAMWPFPNGWRSDYTFEHFNLERALRRAGSPEAVAAYLADLGITHMMIDEEITLSADGMGERERALLVGLLRGRGVLLYRNPRERAQSLWRLYLEPGVRGGSR